MRYDKSNSLKYTALTAALTTALCLGLSAPLLAAEATVANKKVPDPSAEPAAATATATEATKCMSDLQKFDAEMQKDGHWLNGVGGGYGYAMSGYAGGLRAGMPLSHPNADAEKGAAAGEKEGTANKNKASDAGPSADYLRARPAYEIHTLIVAANILARRGQQEECEAVLSTTKGIYKDNKVDLENNRTSKNDMSAQDHQRIMSAQPVTSNNASFRFNQLIGTGVVSQQDKDLGSINDVIMDPKTGKIAYLVIGRGGLFGINEKYVPVPWRDFKITANSDLLVLDTNKDTMDGAPQVEENNFSKNGGFSVQSKKIDDYWKVPQS